MNSDDFFFSKSRFFSASPFDDDDFDDDDFDDDFDDDDVDADFGDEDDSVVIFCLKNGLLVSLRSAEGIAFAGLSRS